MTNQTPKTIRREDYTAPDFLIHDVKLHFSLDAENTKVLYGLYNDEEELFLNYKFWED